MARKETDLTDEQVEKLEWLAKHFGTSERNVLRMALVWYHTITKFFNKNLK